MRTRLLFLVFLGLFIFGCCSLFQEQGCKYNNPSCASGSSCINNACVPQGCESGTVTCDSGYACFNNECVQEEGCDYDNPKCDGNSDCINNVCLKKKGCQYANPQCDAGYECQDNTCVKELSYNFIFYKNTEPYYSNYCDKINPYDLSVRKVAADAIRNDSGAYGAAQIFDIYDWVTKNIIYQNVPLTGVPSSPSETLTTKSGDSKNQAVLLAAMINAIGGTSKVVLDPACKHAYTLAYLGSVGSNMAEFTNAVHQHYGSAAHVRYITIENDMWVILDPAVAGYPGNTLEECSGKRTVYSVTGCLDCAHTTPDRPYTFIDYCYSTCPTGTIPANDYVCGSCPKDYPYAFGDTCYSRCPTGTITNGYGCSSCPQGYYPCNNQCLSCPRGYYLDYDCQCYQG